MTVVVSYSTRNDSRPLFEAAILHARRGDTDLLLLHHAKLRDIDAPQGVDEEVQHVQRVRRELQELAAEAREQGVPCRVLVETSTEEGASGPLLESVSREEAELLIVGIRSRSRVGKLLLGSTAQDLILGAQCPVLAVKVPQR